MGTKDRPRAVVQPPLAVMPDVIRTTRLPSLHARFSRTMTHLGFGVCLVALAQTSAHAQRIENQVAVFAALDKVTARISRLEIKLGDTVKFGALKVTPKLCYSRPPDQPPKTTTFVEVQEQQLDGSQKKLFAGWMFAESPGLDAVEHPVYDVWLTECMGPKAVAGRAPGSVAGAAASKQGAAAPGQAAAPPTGAADEDVRRRRPPR
jgi:hypothetical protein